MLNVLIQHIKTLSKWKYATQLIISFQQIKTVTSLKHKTSFLYTLANRF